jgi:hypothetical protein
VEASKAGLKPLNNRQPFPKKYMVLIHGARVVAVNMDKQTESIKKIIKQNPALQERIHILRVHWHHKTIGLKKTAGAVFIDLPSTEDVNLLINDRLFLNSELNWSTKFSPEYGLWIL